MISKQKYKKSLQKKLDMKNIHTVPELYSIVVSIGIGSLVTRKGQSNFEELEKNLRQITGQKPRIVKAKKSVSNFKLREGMPVMLQCSLRGQRALDFIDRLVKLVLPRERDFIGLNTNGFDKQANITIGIKNYNIFPELSIDAVTIPMGIGITLVTSTDDLEESKALLQELGLIFTK